MRETIAVGADSKGFWHCLLRAIRFCDSWLVMVKSQVAKEDRMRLG